MKIVTDTEKITRIDQVECKTCGAKVSASCTNKDNKKMSGYHVARTRAFQAAVATQLETASTPEEPSDINTEVQNDREAFQSIVDGDVEQRRQVLEEHGSDEEEIPPLEMLEILRSQVATLQFSVSMLTNRLKAAEDLIEEIKDSGALTRIDDVMLEKIIRYSLDQQIVDLVGKRFAVSFLE